VGGKTTRWRAAIVRVGLILGLLVPVVQSGAIRQRDDTDVGAAQELHPALVFTREEWEAATARGVEAARRGRGVDSVTKECARKLRWVRGKKSGGGSSEVFWLDYKAAGLALEAYRAAANYEPVPTLQAGASRAEVTRLCLDVVLTSMPRVRTSVLHALRAALGVPGQSAGVQDADENDVRVTKFVLSTDGAHHYVAEEGETSGQQETGIAALSGAERIVHKGTARTDAYAYGSASGSGGHASGSAAGTARSTYTREEWVPWSSERPYYRARYRVYFAVREKDGTPRVTRDTKEVTLHVITPNGEQMARYALPVDERPKR